MANESSFKVNDRRHFNADGSRRQVGDEEEERAAVPAPEPDAKGSTPGLGRTPAPEVRNEPPSPARELPATRPEFKALVQYLGEQALLAISGQLNLPVAQVMEIVETNIAFLEVLNEKTRSNLSPDEEQWLHDILTQLRFSFLELKKAKGTRPAKH